MKPLAALCLGSLLILCPAWPLAASMPWRLFPVVSPSSAGKQPLSDASNWTLKDVFRGKVPQSFPPPFPFPFRPPSLFPRHPVHSILLTKQQKRGPRQNIRHAAQRGTCSKKSASSRQLTPSRSIGQQQDLAGLPHHQPGLRARVVLHTGPRGRARPRGQLHGPALRRKQLHCLVGLPTRRGRGHPDPLQASLPPPPPPLEPPAALGPCPRGTRVSIVGP